MRLFRTSRSLRTAEPHERATTRGALRRREKRRTGARRLRAGAAGLAVAVAVGIGAVGLTPAAVAATDAYGVGELSGSVIGWQGSMRTADGSFVFCVDPGTDFPHGGDTPRGYVTSWKGVSGDRLAGVNRILHEIAASDRDHAAANFVIKHVFDPAAMYRTHRYPATGAWPYGNLGRYIEWVLSTTYPDAGGGWRSIRDRALQLLDVVDSTTAGSGVSGSGTLVLTVDDANHYDGTVTMEGTAGSTGTITLTNGVFSDSGKASRSDAREGVAYAIRGVPPQEDGQPYRISASGRFTPPGTAGYRAEIALWSNPEQNMAAAGRRATPAPFAVEGQDTTTRKATFQPILTTTAQAYVERGEAFTDVVRFATAPDAEGVDNPWYEGEGGYVPVFAEAVVYGPFAAPVATPSDDVPADAPVAGEMNVTTGAEGPTIEYTVRTRETATTSGFYYYVWSIDHSRQDAGTQRFVAEDWSFQDQFGLGAEQSIVPMQVTATTQVPTPEVALGGVPADTAEIAVDGYWLRSSDGENLPVTVRWDAYFDPGTEPVAQVPASEIPDEAALIGSYTTQVTGPGTIETPASAAELGFTAPAAGEGHIVWVLSVRDEDQGDDAAMITEWSDDYGVPTEIQRIAQPTVVTDAVAGVRLGGTATDVASVGGTLPATGANLSFAAYAVPVDAGGQAPADLSAVCVDAHRIFDDHGSPRLVTEPGDYTSPEVAVDEYALILWVERLSTVPAEGEEPQIIHEGECGIPNETTHVLDVTTRARSTEGGTTVEPAHTLWDTVVLTGWVPSGGSLQVDLYRFDPSDPVCDEPIWSSEPLALDGGLHTDGLEIDLAEHGQTFTVRNVDDGMQLGFVETTRDAAGRVVSRGDCGEPDETVTVRSAPLAATGGPATAMPLAVGAALLAAGGLAVIAPFALRRLRSRTAREG